MKVYKFSRDTKEFTKDGVANHNPRNPKNPILPGFACWDAPPETKVNEVAVRNNDNTFWVVKKDLRGKKYYLKENGTPQEVLNIDEDIPETGIDESPPIFYISPKYQGNKWVDTAPTLEETIDSSPIDIDHALEEMFSIIKGDKIAPKDFDSFKESVKNLSKFKNFENLDTKVKKEKINVSLNR